MSHELIMILEIVAFGLSLLGNLVTVVGAGCALVFAFRRIKIRK